MLLGGLPVATSCKRSLSVLPHLRPADHSCELGPVTVYQPASHQVKAPPLPAATAAMPPDGVPPCDAESGVFESLFESYAAACGTGDGVDTATDAAYEVSPASQ